MAAVWPAPTNMLGAEHVADRTSHNVGEAAKPAAAPRRPMFKLGQLQFDWSAPPLAEKAGLQAKPENATGFLFEGNDGSADVSSNLAVVPGERWSGALRLAQVTEL